MFINYINVRYECLVDDGDLVKIDILVMRCIFICFVGGMFI